mgnify:CR=1 FL=1
MEDEGTAGREALPFALSFIEWLSKKAGTEGGGQPINLKVGTATESGFTATLKTDRTEGIVVNYLYYLLPEF